MKQWQSNALTSVSRIVRIRTHHGVLLGGRALTLVDGGSLASSAPGWKPPSLGEINESSGLLEVFEYFGPYNDTKTSERCSLRLFTKAEFSRTEYHVNLPMAPDKMLRSELQPPHH